MRIFFIRRGGLGHTFELIVVPLYIHFFQGAWIILDNQRPYILVGNVLLESVNEMGEKGDHLFFSFTIHCKKDRRRILNKKRESTKSMKFKKEIAFGLVIILWFITAWLLYPLIILDSVDMENAKEYLYRSAIGITIMIILFGKTILDLFFPQVTFKTIPLLNTIFLTIYSIALAGGIIFMIIRMIILLMKSRTSGFLF